MSRFLVPMVVMLALVGLATRTQAQTPEEVALARRLFHEGVELSESGSWQDAADRFRRAHHLRPSPILAYNLSIADTHIGRLVEATEMLEWTLRESSTSDAIRVDAEQRLEALRPRLAHATVRLTGHPEGSALWIDGRAVPRVAIGVEMPVDPGTRQIQIRRGDDVLIEVERTLEEGESSPWVFEVPAPAAEIDPAVVARQRAAEIEAERAREREAHAAQMQAMVEAARAREEGSEDAGRRRRRRIGVGVGVALALAAGGAITAVLLTRDGSPQGTLPTVDWR